MNNFKEFIDALILAESLSNNIDKNLFVNYDNDMYFFRGFYQADDGVRIYLMKVDIRHKTVNFCIDFDGNYGLTETIDSFNQKIVRFRKFINKKFKGILNTSIIVQNKVNTIYMSGNTNALKEFISDHKAIMLEFLNQKVG